MQKDARKVPIMIKVAPDQRAHVEHTAKAEGISISAVVRRAIKRDPTIQNHATRTEGAR